METERTEIMEEDRLLREAEAECHRQMAEQESFPRDGVVMCESVWDGWGCWNYTSAGTRTSISCPSYIPGFDPYLKAYRDCNDDGTWWQNPFNKTWSNYTSCVNQRELQKNTRLINVYVSGYSISMLALTVSIAIFLYFGRQLHCERVTLHKHLFGSYIMNGMAWILYYTLAALNADVLEANPIWCQSLHVITQYLVTCNFFWMFCEGLYLHTVIAIAFTSAKRLLYACYIIGWGLPIITTIIYAATRANDKLESQRCWINESHFQWIVSGPIVTTIITNLMFLCNIVRVLVTKLRAVNSPDAIQAKKAVRATIILIPLLGVQYILFPMRPPEGTLLEEIYLLVIALVTSLQGLFVAILFCFFNGEVMHVISRGWQRRDSALRRMSTTQTVTLHTTSNNELGLQKKPTDSQRMRNINVVTPLRCVYMTSQDDDVDETR